MNEEMNVVENEEANDPLRQLRDRLVNETGLSPNFVSRCLDGDMDALAQLDETDRMQFAILLSGIPMFYRWWLTLYETSLPEFNLKTLCCDWRLAGGEIVLAPLRLVAREVAAEFPSAEEDEIEKLVREQLLELTVLSDAQCAEILECSVEVFRKIRRGFSGRGLIFFEPAGEDKFRIHVRWNPKVCQELLLPLAEMLKRTEFFERFPPPLVQTIQ